MWTLTDGRVSRRSVLGLEGQGIPELGAARYRLFGSAAEVNLYESKSGEWKNPVVEVELQSGNEKKIMLLPALDSKSEPLPDGKTYLAFEAKPDDVKAYRSALSVIEGGKAVAAKTVAVNDPLVYKGYHFYQSNFRKEDPSYSGLLVVKDPGLGLIWAGFIMISVGVIYSSYLRPRPGPGRKSRDI